ncbi:hypothetical protein ACHAXT_005530 [Thalassiosira profunda]
MSSMIKLAPSPRDSANLSSPRSLRRGGVGSPRGSPRASPRSSPRTKACTPRARNNKGMADLAAGFPEGPEMAAAAFPKAALFAASGGGSPRSATSKSPKAVPAEPSGSYTAAGTSAGTAGRSSPRLKKSAERRTSPPSTPEEKADALNTTGDAVAQSSPSRKDEAGNKTRSKKMMVVDPSSGKKVKLHADDHSLTDKELHVYHKKERRQQQRHAHSKSGTPVGNLFKDVDGASRRHRRTQSEGTLSTQHTVQTYSTELNSIGETLETASALTEVSYFGRRRIRSGPFECIVPTSCRSVEHLALGGVGEFVRFGGPTAEEEKLREKRDDVETVEKERFKHLLEEGEGTGGAKGKGLQVDTDAYEEAHTKEATPPPALLSPLSALGGLVSPRISSMAKTFFDGQNAFMAPEGTDVVEVKFRRICLVVFPDEVRQCLAPREGHRRRAAGLLGMTFAQSGEDFQAHVSHVQRGSKADRMGVRRGDVVSFAVALSNMTEEQNSFLAEKLIKRLESVGMRTSYRELYDIFLSKTTNARPIGLVFRRWKNRGGSPRNLAAKIGITDEFEWSTDFLQSLSIKCREHEFEQKVPLGLDEDKDAEDLPLRKFLPKPNVDTTPSSGALVDYVTGLLGDLGKRYNCANGTMQCVETTCGMPETSANDATDDFLSNKLLRALVEQSMGLIFVRRVLRSSGGGKASQSGSGFAVVRKAEGSWSAPCFLSVLGSKDRFTEGADADSSSNDVDVKVIVIRKTEMVNNLIAGNAVKFSVRSDERANVLVRDAAIIGVQEGKFQLSTDFFLAAKVNDIQNQGAYSLSTNHVEASDILTGTISPPEQSVDFYGALQSLELPYSMHSHPVIPEMLQRYSDNDWVEFLPESDNASSCGMGTKLTVLSKKGSAEDRREVDIFARKFKYYLMDGVPVHRVLSSNNPGMTEEKDLKLTVKDPSCLFSSSLEITGRRRPGVSNVGIPSNFSSTFENITKLSRTPPAALRGLDEDETKRFFSIETDLSPGPVCMLAKSKKDAMILMCGLKLLLERERLQGAAEDAMGGRASLL